MKVDSQVKQNVENKDVNVQMTQEDNELLTNVNMPFSDVLAQGAGTQTVQTASIEYLSSLPVKSASTGILTILLQIPLSVPRMIGS